MWYNPLHDDLGESVETPTIPSRWYHTIQKDFGLPRFAPLHDGLDELVEQMNVHVICLRRRGKLEVLTIRVKLGRSWVRVLLSGGVNISLSVYHSPLLTSLFRLFTTSNIMTIPGPLFPSWTLPDEYENLFGIYWRYMFGTSSSLFKLLGKDISVRTSQLPQGG